MTIEIIVHSTGVGHCSLLGKEGEGMVVTFKDGTVKEGFLSHKAFQQLIKMKCGQQQGDARPAVPAAVPAAQPVAAGNGPPKS